MTRAPDKVCSCRSNSLRRGHKSSSPQRGFHTDISLNPFYQQATAPTNLPSPHGHRETLGVSRAARLPACQLHRDGMIEELVGPKQVIHRFPFLYKLQATARS